MKYCYYCRQWGRIWEIVFYRGVDIYFHFHFLKQSLDQDSHSNVFLVYIIMEDFFKDLEDKFSKKSRVLGNNLGCIVWVGYAEKNGYGIQRVRWPNVGLKKERSHRVAYMIRHKICANDMPKLDQNDNPLECSHLCHNKLCVNPDHISLEDHATNQERIHCKGQGHCSKCHEPHCLMCIKFIYAKFWFF